MPIKSTIKIITSNKDEYELLFSEQFNLVYKNDTIILKLIDDLESVNLRIVFIDDENIDRLKGTSKRVNNEIVYTVNKWYSDTYVENIEPMMIYSNIQTGIEWFLKLKTVATVNGKHRQVFVTIWKKIKL